MEHGEWKFENKLQILSGNLYYLTKIIATKKHPAFLPGVSFDMRVVLFSCS